MMTNRFTSKSDLCKKQLVLKNAVECIDCDVSYWEISTSKTRTSTIYGNAIDKFFDYEETGLNPEDIDKLKAENEQMKWKLSSVETQRDLKGYNAKRNADIMSSQLKIIEQLKSELEQSDSCDGCKHDFDRNEYYCYGCKRISVDNFELKSEVINDTKKI